MKFATYKINNEIFYGAKVSGGMIALSPDFPNWPTLREVIENSGLKSLEIASEGKSITHKDEDIVYEIPITRPEKIICVGVNYPDRNAEYKDGKAAPSYPSLFIRFAKTFVGHECSIIKPKISEQLDYEGEVVLIIGKEGRHIAQENAFDHIAAITLSNEGTIRDWVRHAKFNVTQGKNFESSGAIGPWIIPFESKEQLKNIELVTRVNGEVRQKDNTDRMIFSFDYIINYISTFVTLVPGDVIITGTPTGAGARFDPPKWLKPGDVVEVEASGVGILKNGVKDEA
jgi:2-keto-4-pentenoate hydratase/2-oxohepta-3-ene-1,7-dioic acid hydratase in catechol pathway